MTGGKKPCSQTEYAVLPSSFFLTHTSGNFEQNLRILLIIALQETTTNLLEKA